jgi:RimJ/RimL family protein N-acetyltransferase
MLCRSCSFKTDRLVVREWHTLSDLDIPHAIVSILTPGVTQSLPDGWQGEYDFDRATKWIAERDSEGATLLVLDRASRAPIGLMILFESEEEGGGRCVRIGYMLAEAAWGRGYGSELLQGFVDWCRTTDIASIIGGVARENRASRRVMEKSGFSVIADTRDQQELVYQLRLQ